MRALRTLFARVGGVFAKARRDREFADELEAHLQEHIADNIHAGMTAAEARRDAMLTLGATESIKQLYRDRRGLPVLETLLQDLRHALRALRKNAGLTVVAVLPLGLGIGVNLALFAGIRALLLQEPTAAESARVVAVEPGNGSQFSYPNYRDLRDSGIFDGVAGSNIARLNLRSGDNIESVLGLIVTGNFFQVLRVNAGLGRVFTEDEASPEQEPHLVVLSHAYWQRRFQSDPGLIGQRINVNGESFLVLGVLPAGYVPVTGVLAPDLYVPLGRLVVADLTNRQNGFGVTTIARLRLDGSAAQAQAALTALDKELEHRYPEQNSGLGRPAKVFPIQGMLFRGAPHEFFLFGTMLAGLSGLVLLIACGNVAGLLLARAAVRQRELAVRVALGASRGRLVQSLLAESLLLAFFGAATGLFLALNLLPALGVVALPGQAPVQITFVQSNLMIYAYGVLLALITGSLCGILPAVRATRTDVVAQVQQGAGRGTTGRMRLRHAFVVAQVAASVTLLVVSSLFLRSLVRRATLEPGFDIDHGLVAIFHLEPTRYSKEGGLLFAQQVLDRLAAIPGVRSGAVASIVPLSGDTIASRSRVRVEGQLASPGARTYLNFVGPAYFKTMGIPLVKGREFQTGDRTGAPPVVIVNQAFANVYFPAGEVLGKRIANGGDQFFEIVGVAKDSSYGARGEAPTPTLYYAWAQLPAEATEARPLMVHLRMEDAPAAALHNVRRAIADLDKTVAVDVRTMDDATSLETSIRRAGSLLLGTLGSLGLLLAMIGLYGVMAYAVASRTTEIGIRMALGASSRRVLWNVLAQGLRLVAIGVATGTALSLGVARPLAVFLGGLSPADPIAFGATAAVLLFVGGCASYFPARRATQIDPMIALRHD